MIVTPDGWCSAETGEEVDDFMTLFIAARDPFTDSEISKLRTIFRSTNTRPAAEAA